MGLTRFVIGFAFLVCATACTDSRNASPVATAIADRNSVPAEPSSTLPAATDFGPIIALRIAHDIEQSGRALGVGIDIEPWAPKIVAVVDVGGWGDAAAKSLQFRWSSVDTAGAESELFDQTVDVKPGQRAFAVALSQGRLALGTYRVMVTRAIDRDRSPLANPESRGTRQESGRCSEPFGAWAYLSPDNISRSTDLPMSAAL